VRLARSAEALLSPVGRVGRTFRMLIRSTLFALRRAGRTSNLGPTYAKIRTLFYSNNILLWVCFVSVEKQGAYSCPSIAGSRLDPRLLDSCTYFLLDQSNILAGKSRLYFKLLDFKATT